MKRILRGLLTLLFVGIVAPAGAADMLMVRSKAPFEETMLNLQQAISDQGYVLSRVQRVDIGLTESGYQTDKFRVVFFGKPEEIRRLSANYPELIPYLPLQIAIFAQADETLLATASPLDLNDAYAKPELAALFKRWEKDLRAILERVRKGQ